jgi:hypothetical protein
MISLVVAIYNFSFSLIMIVHCQRHDRFLPVQSVFASSNTAEFGPSSLHSYPRPGLPAGALDGIIWHFSFSLDR